MKHIYIQYAHYNLWANRRMVEAFAGLTEEQLEQHIESSFPSARHTFLHIWDVEFLWLRRLQGDSPTSFPSKTFEEDTAAVFKNLLINSSAFVDFVQQQPDAFFESVLAFRTLYLGDQTQQAYQMVHHCMNHSTFHRGQLITIGRQLGIGKFPPTDFAFYIREGGK